MRLELCLDWGEMTPWEYRSYAQTAESLGYGTLWVPNSRYFHDVWVTAVFVALATSDVQIGTFVLDPYTGSSISAATAAATLDLISHERVVLAVGAGSASPIVNPGGRSQPLKTVQRFVTEMRAHLSRRTDVNLYQKPETEHIGFAGRTIIPIDVAGRGPGILRIGAAIGDRVQVATMADPQALSLLIARTPALRKVIEERRLGLRIDVAIASADAAVGAVRPILALAVYNSFPTLDFIEVTGHPLAGLQNMSYFSMADATRFINSLPVQTINKLALAGTKEFVLERLERIRASGLADFLIIVPHGRDHEEVLGTVKAISEWEFERNRS